MARRKYSLKRSAEKVCEFAPGSGPEKFRILTEEPSYVCKACERSASKAEYLCQPERVFSAW